MNTLSQLPVSVVTRLFFYMQADNKQLAFRNKSEQLLDLDHLERRNNEKSTEGTICDIEGSKSLRNFLKFVNLNILRI